MAARKVRHSQAVTALDKNMSAAHHKDSIVYNEAHALHHLQEAEKHAKALKTSQKKAGVTSTQVNAQARRLAGIKRRIGKL